MSSPSTNRTVLITGASTGIGKTTARYFYDRGRNVVATMRSPEKEQDLQEDSRLKIFRLDVQDKQSIQEAVSTTLALF